jgi:hypothetical protein
MNGYPRRGRGCHRRSRHFWLDFEVAVRVAYCWDHLLTKQQCSRLHYRGKLANVIDNLCVTVVITSIMAKPSPMVVELVRIVQFRSSSEVEISSRRTTNVGQFVHHDLRSDKILLSRACVSPSPHIHTRDC